MNSSDSLRILPEIILTITGVVVMLIDASMPVGWLRRPLGWVAALGTTAALWSSLWQLNLPIGTGFFGTVETSPFTVFFQSSSAPSCWSRFFLRWTLSPKTATIRANTTR